LNTVAETVLDKGPALIDAIGQLAPWVAIGLFIVVVVALFVYAQKHDKKSTIETIKTVSETIVEPLAQAQRESVGELKTVVTNHLEHDREERTETRLAIQEHTEVLKEVLDRLD